MQKNQLILSIHYLEMQQISGFHDLKGHPKVDIPTGYIKKPVQEVARECLIIPPTMVG